MPITRTDIVRGPALITWGGVTVHTAGDITMTPKVKTFNIPTSFYGETTDTRTDDFQYEVTFTPAGVADVTWITKLYSQGTLDIGSSPFANSDQPLVVWARNGEKHTFGNAICLKPGDMTFSATKPIFGATTFMALRKLNTAWETADSIHQIETAALIDASFAASAIRTGSYTVAWGALAPFATLQGAGDAVFSLNPTYDEVVTNNDGLVDYRLKDCTASVKFQPLGCTLAELKAAMTDAISTAKRGASIVSAAKSFSIAGSNGFPLVTAGSATPLEIGYNFGAGVNRIGEVEFKFNRIAPAVLCTVAGS